MTKLKNITCRKAKLEDLKNILLLCYDFYNEFVMDKPENFKEDYIAKQVQSVINHPEAEIMVIENGEIKPIGMFYVYLAPSYYNPEVKVVEAHHMYLKPEYREGSAVKVMLTAIRQWAKNKGTFWLRESAANNKLKFNIYKGDETCHQQ